MGTKAWGIEGWTGLDELEALLRRHLLGRCRDDAELEDVIQETYLRAARYRPSLADEERLRPWLLSIAGNVWRDHVRRERRLPRQELDEEQLLALEAREGLPGEDGWTFVDDGGAVWDREEALLELGRARSRMRPEELDVLDTYYGGEESCLAAARTLGLTHGQAKVRLFRARRRLSGVLRRLLELRRRALVRAARLLALAALCAAGAVPALAAPSGGACEHALALRRAAWRARARIAEREGAERERARALAVEAWHELARRCPGEPALAAEAAFRAAELWRAGGELERARAELLAARAAGERSGFRGRAGIALGDLERAAGRPREAHAAYEAVALDGTSRPWERERALVGMGSALADQGRAADARRLWGKVAEGEGDPLERVRAFDRLAEQCVALGDPAGAAGWLARARERLAPIAAERTHRGARVRSALERMRAIRALKLALARESGLALDRERDPDDE
jgi:RNA polymerase sigma-70 factor (ECF subfamily)